MDDDVEEAPNRMDFNSLRAMMEHAASGLESVFASTRRDRIKRQYNNAAGWVMNMALGRQKLVTQRRNASGWAKSIKGVKRGAWFSPHDPNRAEAEAGDSEDSEDDDWDGDDGLDSDEME